MDTHLLVVHVTAEDETAAINGIKSDLYIIDHIETLEGYCGTCEERCTIRNCEQKSR